MAGIDPSLLQTIDFQKSISRIIIEEILVENHFIFEHQQMWIFAILLHRETISKNVLKICALYLQKKTYTNQLDQYVQ
jgi:hypothetical protein